PAAPSPLTAPRSLHAALPISAPQATRPTPPPRRSPLATTPPRSTAPGGRSRSSRAPTGPGRCGSAVPSSSSWPSGPRPRWCAAAGGHRPAAPGPRPAPVRLRSETQRAEGVGRPSDGGGQRGVADLEADHLVAQLLDEALLGVGAVEPALHLTGQTGELLPVV